VRKCRVPSLQSDFVGTSRFEVLGKIGAGGMGVVYEALDREQGSRVALKMLRRLEPDALMRFKQEFRALADVNHPNLVGLRELVCEGDHWFVTMELIEGVDFLHWVRPGTVTTFADTLASDPQPTAQEPSPAAAPITPAALDLSRLRAAMHQLGAGVQALHRLGKLHCDLKPSNVLVTKAGRVVVLDFGLMTDLELEGRRSVDTIVGTAGYMPPEQGASARLTEAADWYAVGSMLYEALTGRLPYAGSTLQMLMAKRQQDPPPPESLAEGVPTDLAALSMDLLARDPAARPNGKEVLRRLGATPEVTGTRTERVPLVGRQKERAVLERALASAGQGKPVCVVVHGHSGMGKSTLVRRFLNDVGERATVLAGRCYERESVPYKALDSVIDALCRHLRRLPIDAVRALAPLDGAALLRIFPVLSRVNGLANQKRAIIPDSGEVRRRAGVALRELLAKLAARAPLVLFIDDLQWGDADSSILLGELLAPPDPPALLLVACHRSEGGADGPVVTTLRAPRPGVETVEIQIDALGDDDARLLARALLGDTGGHVEVAAREAQGSPFLLVQLAQHLHSGEGLVDAGGQLRFEDLVRTRMARLGPRGRRLLEVVAVAGRPLAKEIARTAAGIDALDDTLAPLVAGQLLRTSRAHGHETVECYHDRIRETVIGLLEPSATAAHHAQLARTLEAQGGEDAEALALHYEAAGQRQRASSWAIVAADRAAAALAFDHAAQLYRRALTQRQVVDEERRELEAKLAGALAGAGRGQEAAHAYLVAAAGASRAVGLERRQRAAQQFLRAGYIDEGEAVLKQVLTEVGVATAPETTGRIVAGLMWNRLRIRLRGYDFDERLESTIPGEDLARLDTLWGVATGLAVVDFLRPVYFNQVHLIEALKLGEPTRIACALSLEAGTLVAHERGAVATRSARLLARARQLADHTGDPRALAMVCLMGGITDLQLARWAPALTSCDEAEQILRERCSNVAWELGTAQLMSGTCLAFLGHFDELQRRVPPILREGHERGDLYVSTSAPGFLHLAWIAGDDVEGLRTTVRETLLRWSPRGYHVQHSAALSAEVDADLYVGDAESACRRAEADWPRMGLLLRSALARHGAVSVLGRAALGNARSADAPSLRVVATCVKRLERDRHMPYPIALALMLRAGVAAVRGDRAQAATLYERATVAAEGLAMTACAAATRRRLGQLRGGADGAALVAEADAALRRERVKNPERFAAMLAPAPCLD
jgi:tRNA A-37 threonylcarbamoyl transferase component Bud32